MGIIIKRYTDGDFEQWEKFVHSSLNGTFLHSRSFFDHNDQNMKDDCSFLFYKNNGPIAILPCSLYSAATGLVLHSHLRATYAGFVISKKVNVAESVEMVGILIEEAARMNVKKIIVRNPFRIFNTDLCDETDYAMWYHGFKIKSREIEIAISLSGTIEEIKNNYDSNNKYKIKKANKAIQVRETEDIASYWQLLDRTLMDRHNVKPVHSIQDINKLISLCGKESVKLFAGFVNDKMVAGIFTFLFRGNVIHAQYICSDFNYQDLRPLNAVVDYIIDWGKNNHYRYFNLGMANEDEGKKINYGLFHFKEGFGGRGVLRETMYLDL